MASHRPPGKSLAQLGLRASTRLRAGRAFVAFAGLILTYGCRDAASALGSSAAGARRNGDQLFNAIATRFSGVVRSPGYEAARTQIASATLVPSRVWDDSLWSARTAASRTYYVAGEAVAPARFRLDSRTGPPPLPARPGDMRRTITLVRTESNVFEWNKTSDLAIGTYAPDDFGRTLRALFALPERHTAAALHTDLAAAFPRSTSAFGRLFSLDSLSSVAISEGGWASEAVLRVDPSRMRATYPHYADYLAKYALPVNAAFTVTDSTGAVWLRGSLADGRLRIRWRSSGGQLMPSSGPPRRMPQQLRVDADVITKFGMFTVGGRHLHTDLRLTTAPRERGFTLTAREEPDWDLPLISERLLRTPLRRPFLGPGASFSFALRDTLGHELVSTRSHVAVEESAIVRFLAGISHRAVTDFDPTVTAEQEAFLRECFVALRADLRAL